MGPRGSGAYQSLELELHREARDAHGCRIRVFALGVGLCRRKVAEVAEAREHVGDEPVVLVLGRVSKGCPGTEIQLVRVIAYQGDSCTAPGTCPFWR